MDKTLLPTSFESGQARAEQSERSTPGIFTRGNLILSAALYVAALITLVVFNHAVGQHVLRPSSDAPHYVYQAEAFLHGRWNIDMPASYVDVIKLHGLNYIVYPPFPALVYLPVVAFMGLKTPDPLITIFIASLNLPLLYLLFEQARVSGLTRRPIRDNLIFAILLYFGSINLWLSIAGRMWFEAHVIGFTCSTISLLLALRGRYGWAAFALGCAFFSRSTVAVFFPVVFYFAWQGNIGEHNLEAFLVSLWRRAPRWQDIPWRRLAAPLAVTCVVVLLFGWRNWYLFGSPFDSGYSALLSQHYPQVTHGPFNIRYVPSNIIGNFFTFPNIYFNGPFDRHPTLDMLNGGVSVSPFVTTPLFLYLFWRNRTFSATRVALWISIGLLVIALLLFHAIGWIEFGNRYLYDGYPWAFLLLVMTDAEVDWRVWALGAFAIVVNILGAVEFWRGVILHFTI